MSEYYKKADFYYIVVPILVLVWAVLVWVLALPTAQSRLNRKQSEFNQAEELITKILELDSERLDYEKKKEGSAKFDYTDAVNKFTRQCGISPSDYSLQAGRETERRNQRTKSANIGINSVSIEKFTKFISLMLLQHSDLQCDQLKLTKIKAGPDTWKASLKFTYYY